MKPGIILLLLLATFGDAITQSNNKLTGIVVLKDDEQKTLSGVSVTAVGVANGAITDSDGYFSLVCVGQNAGDVVTLLVKKDGYVVLEENALKEVTIRKDPTRLLRIVMQEKNKRESEVKRAEENIKNTIINHTDKQTKALNARLAHIEGKLQQSGLNDIERKAYLDSIQKLNTEKYSLLNDRDKAIQLARETAEKLTAFDVSKASDEARRSDSLFRVGNLEGAYAALDENKMKERAKATKELLEQTIKDYMQKGQLAIANGKFEEAERLYTEGVRLDSANVDNIWTLSYFLREQNKIYEAIHYYEKALSLAQTPELKATFQNNLGNLYRVNQKMPQAEEAYNEALKIYSQLAEKNPDAFLPDLATCLNNLGTYYYSNQKMPQAEEAYNEALKIYRQLAEENPDAFLLCVAGTLNNLGLFYSENQKMSQAERAYNEALKIRKQLAEKNPDVFLPDLAITLDNLGLFYSTNQKIPQAEEAYNQALKISRQLAEKNPDAFLPDLAMTLNNLGVFYIDNQKMPQAEGAYNEALRIRRQLAEKNPDAFLPILASTLNNLGDYYRVNQRMQQAEDAFDEALKIYRQSAEKNPDAFLRYLASTLNNLGIYYWENQKMQKAERAYNEALVIRRQLAEKNPDAFLAYLAETLNNLGVLYKTVKQYDKALDYYCESSGYREGAILKGGRHFLNYWEQVQRNITIVKDSAEVKKDYVSVVKAGRFLAEGYDSLKGIKEKLLPIAVSEYGSLSWWALFVKDYALSEKAARRCLELDETQTYVLTNLGHSQILRGQYNSGMATYEKLKGKKDDNNKDYKTLILEDLQSLEEAGVSHPDVAKARKAIEKW
ncbi:tetratricopeptide repeat protein [Runella sp.]|uniref:tetratricopeptide repeat protein n=1 Tax=Runella sp. TaxID=1960881 RepID=UPI003019C685